ncbi:ABC transporter permease [Microbacterium immunditiarum]|uniref:Ribose transport system permease protein n=1 Tax=Microbacterium immunditiarum TaxID=337480 RepID=A0A7Y9GMT5_9MICO|nr:ABC transporter permease [Microbacterium immunditiarum]NYE19399.1 ribose transport system permease protein [Microbacterium immunditiarum]
MRSRLKRVSPLDYGIVISFVAVFVTLAIASPVFATPQNLLNLLEQSAVVGIIAVGGTLVIIAGGFDLSVGAIFALSGIVTAFAVNTFGALVGVLCGLAVGALIGLVNGLMSTVGGINPFITTLATSIIVRGVCLAVTGGFLIAIQDPGFSVLGRGGIGGVKFSVIVFAIVVIAGAILLSRTVFGRQVYAAGGNPEAARLAGVNVARVRTVTFIISGVCAAIAGIIIASRSGNGQANIGIGLEFSAIAAIAVGGTSIFGGEGAIWRTVLGVLLIALIGNGFTLLAVPPTFQQVFEGTIILIAVGFDLWFRRRRRGGQRA